MTSRNGAGTTVAVVGAGVSGMAMGLRLQKAGDATEKRLRYGFELCLGRPPKDRETFAKLTADLAEKHPELKGAKVDLAKTFDDRFVRKAAAGM